MYVYQSIDLNKVLHALSNTHKPPKSVAPSNFMLEKNCSSNVLISSVPINGFK